MKLAAVQKSGGARLLIVKPSKAVQLAAVQENGYAIRHIKNPCKMAIELANQ